MNIITFNADSFAKARGNKATFFVSRKAANFINASAVKLTGFEDGDLIGISQDADSPQDWYLCICEAGIKLRSKAGGGLQFSVANISNAMLDVLEIEGNGATFLIADEPTIVDDVHFWPLLTRNPLIRNRKTKK